MLMRVVQVDITSHLAGVPNLQALLGQEFATVSRWKEEGILEHLFVKDDQAGAILVFKNVEEAHVEELIPTLPLSSYFTHVAYSAAEKQF